jgi:hypothetical protein
MDFKVDENVTKGYDDKICILVKLSVVEDCIR